MRPRPGPVAGYCLITLPLGMAAALAVLAIVHCPATGAATDSSKGKPLALVRRATERCRRQALAGAAGPAWRRERSVWVAERAPAWWRIDPDGGGGSQHPGWYPPTAS